MSTSRDELYDKLAKAKKYLDLANKLNTEDKDLKRKNATLPIIASAKSILDDVEKRINNFKEGDAPVINRLLGAALVQLQSTGYKLPRVVNDAPAPPAKASNPDTSSAGLQTSWCLSTLLCGLFAPTQDKPATEDENTTLTGEQKKKPGSPGLNLRENDD